MTATRCRVSTACSSASSAPPTRGAAPISLLKLRAATVDTLADKDESELLIALGPHLESFLAKLFGIEEAARELARRGNALAPLYEVKRLFVQRVAVKKFKPEEAEGFDPVALAAAMSLKLDGPDDGCVPPRTCRFGWATKPTSAAQL